MHKEHLAATQRPPVSLPPPLFRHRHPLFGSRPLEVLSLLSLLLRLISPFASLHSSHFFLPSLLLCIICPLSRFFSAHSCLNLLWRSQSVAFQILSLFSRYHALQNSFEMHVSLKRGFKRRFLVPCLLLPSWSPLLPSCPFLPVCVTLPVDMCSSSPSFFSLMNFGHFAATDGAAGSPWWQGPGLTNWREKEKLVQQQTVCQHLSKRKKRRKKNVDRDQHVWIPSPKPHILFCMEIWAHFSQTGVQSPHILFLEHFLLLFPPPPPTLALFIFPWWHSG